MGWYLIMMVRQGGTCDTGVWSGHVYTIAGALTELQALGQAPRSLRDRDGAAWGSSHI